VLGKDQPQGMQPSQHRVDLGSAIAASVCLAHLLDKAITLGWWGW
jgi:hypothetical protein